MTTGEQQVRDTLPLQSAGGSEILGTVGAIGVAAALEHIYLMGHPETARLSDKTLADIDQNDLYDPKLVDDGLHYLRKTIDKELAPGLFRSVVEARRAIAAERVASTALASLPLADAGPIPIQKR